MAAVLEDITVTDYQKTSIIEARRASVVENLTAAFPSISDLPFSRAQLMGSAAKGTIVRPIDDIDVLASFDNMKNASASAVPTESSQLRLGPEGRQ